MFYCINFLWEMQGLLVEKDRSPMGNSALE